MRRSLSEILGRGDCWAPIWFSNLKGIRYRVVFGGRGTAKSTDIGGFEPIFKILTDPNRNILFVRKNDSDNTQSTYAKLQWCISYLGLDSLFWCRSQPNVIIYKKTGQCIYFRGFNNPTGLTSVAVKTGELTDCYIEEAFEINDEAEFRKLDGSIRPIKSDGQITFLLNPWDVDCWIYKKFCEGNMPDDEKYMETHPYQFFCDPNFVGDKGKGLAIHRSAYTINPFLPKDTADCALAMKLRSPSIYRVEYLGLWGNSTEGTYPEFQNELVRSHYELMKLPYVAYAIGVDTGFSNGEGKVRRDGKIKAATTAILVGITADWGKIVALGEFFWTNDGKSGDKVKRPDAIMTDMLDKILQWDDDFRPVPYVMKGAVDLFIDSADVQFPSSLQLVIRSENRFKTNPCMQSCRFNPSTKKMTIRNRVDFERLMMAWNEVLVSERCPNLIREIRASKVGKQGEPRDDLNDHALNAFEYAWAPFRFKITRWKDFKER